MSSVQTPTAYNLSHASVFESGNHRHSIRNILYQRSSFGHYNNRELMYTITFRN